ncbi:MAG: RnfABCDGE type electron transport complex subunit D [Bacilli bacterium]|nr:RnfABCDGE type electron transport complex subunit D [Bacilli bacterium]
MAKKFVLEKAPFIRSADEQTLTTSQMMKYLVIALIPIIVFGWLKNGLLPYINQFMNLNTDLIPYLDSSIKVSLLEMLYPLIFVLCGGLFSIGLEGLYFFLFRYYFPNKYTTPKKDWNLKTIYNEVKYSYAVIPGLLLALILPVNTPLYVLFFGCFFANIVFKMLYGGFGRNVFNPALIAYAIITLAFWGVISENGGSLNALEVVTGATPLNNFKNLSEMTYENAVAPYGNLWSFFLGFIPGAIGETSSILIILAFVYLVIKKVITPIIPVFYVGTVFLISTIIMFVNGYGIWYPLLQVLNGGLLFGAVFMATEPVTTPRSPNGKAIYAIFVGIFTMIFRLFGSLPGGVGTAILLVCLFSGIIDRFSAKIRMHRTNYKNALRYLLVLIVVGLLITYIVLRAKV